MRVRVECVSFGIHRASTSGRFSSPLYANRDLTNWAAMPAPCAYAAVGLVRLAKYCSWLHQAPSRFPSSLGRLGWVGPRGATSRVTSPSPLAAPALGVGLYFAVKGLNFFRYFAEKGAKFRENFAKISKFREIFEISLKFRNFLRVHMASSEQGGATQS